MTERPFLALVAVAATLAAGAALAQSATAVDPAYTNLSNYLVNQNRSAVEAMAVAPPSGANTTIVQQEGSGNTATLDIQGANNYTTQTQSGAGNWSAVTILGSSNSVGTAQTGAGNSSTVSLTGNANSVSQTQTGSHLSFGLSITGDNKSVSVTQVGGNSK